MEQMKIISERPYGIGVQVAAKVISWIFHPIFLPTLIAYAVIKFNPVLFGNIAPRQLNLYLISIFLSTTFFPLLFILLLRAVGFVKDIRMPTARERIIPLIGVMTFYFWIFLVSKGTDQPLIIRSFLLGIFLCVTILFLFTLIIKPSLHTAGIGGLIGVMGILLFTSTINLVLPMGIAILLGGIVGTSRLILNAHLSREIWLGYIIGIISQVASYLYLT